MNPNQLPIAFQRTFAEPIWRLIFEEIETAPGLLVAELRNRQTQTLTLATATLPEGILIAEIQPDLPFHCALIGVWNGFALYHRFDNNRLPVPTALGGVDLKTGRTRWEWPQHVFKGADSEHVWAQRVSLTDTALLPLIAFQLADGEPVESAKKPSFVHNPALQFPVSYTTSSPWWPVVDRFIKKTTNHQPIDSVDYLEVGDKLIFSYYYRETNDQIRSFLLITDRRQGIWLHQHTDQAIATTGATSESNALPLFGNGSFCVWQNQLIFPSSPTCITSFYLTPMP
ncbi:hypothetical protein GCM10027347_15440 [Larkinella harenae]